MRVTAFAMGLRFLFIAAIPVVFGVHIPSLRLVREHRLEVCRVNAIRCTAKLMHLPIFVKNSNVPKHLADETLDAHLAVPVFYTVVDPHNRIAGVAAVLILPHRSSPDPALDSIFRL